MPVLHPPVILFVLTLHLFIQRPFPTLFRISNESLWVLYTLIWHWYSFPPLLPQCLDILTNVRWWSAQILYLSLSFITAHSHMWDPPHTHPLPHMILSGVCNHKYFMIAVITIQQTTICKFAEDRSMNVEVGVLHLHSTCIHECMYSIAIKIK